MTCTPRQPSVESQPQVCTSHGPVSAPLLLQFLRQEFYPQTEPDMNLIRDGMGGGVPAEVINSAVYV